MAGRCANLVERRRDRRRAPSTSFAACIPSSTSASISAATQTLADAFLDRELAGCRSRPHPRVE